MADDFRSRVGEREWAARVELAAAYRVIKNLGWDHLIYNHITLRLTEDEGPGKPATFLINPFGLLYEEVTASSLLKVDIDGAVLDAGDATQNYGFGVSKAGFLLHAAIHGARGDAACIFHVHTRAGAAVSALPRSLGLLPLTQEALIVGPVSYHEYNGILVDDAEKQSIAADLGPSNKVLVMRHHGLVAVGGTVAEAFHYLFNLILACEAQALMPASLFAEMRAEGPSEAVAGAVLATVTRGGGGVSTTAEVPAVGQLEWRALMRRLAAAGSDHAR